MGKFKGFLKKVSGSLKIAVACLPIVAGIGGLVTEVGLLIGTTLYYKGVQNDFRENDYFIERRIEDLEGIEQQYESGEIDKVEYSHKIDYLASNDYLVDVIEDGGEQTTEFQAKLKNVKECTIGLITVGALTVAGLIGCGVAAYGHDYIDDLFESGKEDFRYKASNAPPKSKKKKREYDQLPHEPREPIPEKLKNDDDDGFESDEGEYENIDDYFDRFQGK